jgi:homogentisate 1,2-dioxygenase
MREARARQTSECADVRLSPACAPITTGGDVNTQTGFAHSVYSITSSMVDAYFYNGDAEMLFVFEHGNVRFWTEFGIIDAEPACGRTDPGISHMASQRSLVARRSSPL